MTNNQDLIGKKFGKLTVLDIFRTKKGAKKCRCRCDCGKDTSVYYTNLVSGRTKSCGCLMRQNQKKYRDLSGMQFGELLALSPTDKRGSDGSIIWTCRCSCGQVCEVNERYLVRGHRRDCGCGCGTNKKKGHPLDLTGKTFGELTALHLTDKRDKKGSAIWHCRCTCGKEKDFTEDALLHGHTVSCGHVREENGKKLRDNLHFVENSCVEFLKRKKRIDNKTGYTGVFRTSQGTYRASITLNKVRYYLGTYPTLEEAVKARREGVKRYHQPFLDKYEQATEK
ncbi:AP2/ERF family transcription factor [Pseudoramibacter porci]|uniref:AP2 domain-containing protein n=1 Tax=Pseudoramibacter porci TaxID=2606631 RepID=A0A7X2T9D5_9FIRM|nr:hypothetical protein [Pseudoramibacter porci]MSS19419.1 hypothetical protein [Pseudoramibacter porci]